jgi:hypothetical protein
MSPADRSGTPLLAAFAVVGFMAAFGAAAVISRPVDGARAAVAQTASQVKLEGTTTASRPLTLTKVDVPSLRPQPKPRRRPKRQSTGATAAPVAPVVAAAAPIGPVVTAAPVPARAPAAPVAAQPRARTPSYVGKSFDSAG